MNKAKAIWSQTSLEYKKGRIICSRYHDGFTYTFDFSPWHWWRIPRGIFKLITSKRETFDERDFV